MKAAILNFRSEWNRTDHGIVMRFLFPYQQGVTRNVCLKRLNITITNQRVSTHQISRLLTAYLWN